MIAIYQRKSNVTAGIAMAGILLGILLCFGSGFLHSLAPLFLLAGWVMVWFALCYYASAKGYSAVYGMLWLIGLIGLLILLALPDKCKEEDAPTGEESIAA